MRLSYAKHRSISIVSNVVATIRPTWPNAWWDPGGTRVGPPVRNHAPRRASRCLARRMEKVRLASPTTRASALGSMSSKRLSLTTQERLDMSHLCHMYVKVEPMTPIKGLVRKNVPPVLWKTSRKMIIIIFFMIWNDVE